MPDHPGNPKIKTTKLAPLDALQQERMDEGEMSPPPVEDVPPPVEAVIPWVQFLGTRLGHSLALEPVSPVKEKLPGKTKAFLKKQPSSKDKDTHLSIAVDKCCHYGSIINNNLTDWLTKGVKVVDILIMVTLMCLTNTLIMIEMVLMMMMPIEGPPLSTMLIK